MLIAIKQSAAIESMSTFFYGLIFEGTLPFFGEKRTKVGHKDDMEVEAAVIVALTNKQRIPATINR